MSKHKFQPGDKVRVIENPDMGVPVGSVGTVEEPAYKNSVFVRVTFSLRDSHVPFFPQELEAA